MILISFAAPSKVYNLGSTIGASTVAFIAGSGESHVKMIAKSGWTQGTQAFPNVINNDVFTKLVLHVARIIGFKFRRYRRDNGAKRPCEATTGRFFGA